MARPRAHLDLSTLAEAFAGDGLHGVSAIELAAALGVAKPTLYVHGTRKDALFLRAVESEVERVADRLQAADDSTAGRSAHDRAVACAFALLEYVAARPAGARLLSHTAHHRTSTVAEQVEAALTRIPDRVATMLNRDLRADGLDPTLAPQMARALCASAFALGEHRKAGPRVSRAALAALAGSVVPRAAGGGAEEWPSA
jgi:AcrR family transcriptional regulator